jgi:hypothetical protein
LGGSVADATQIIAAFKFIPKALPTGFDTQRIFATRNARINIRMTATSLMFTLTNSVDAGLAAGTIPIGDIMTVNTPVMVLLTADTGGLASDPHIRCAYKQIGTTGAWTTGFDNALTSTGSIDYTNAQFFVGQANGGANRMNACIGDLYVAQEFGSALDTALQAKFLDANGLPVQLGQYGQRVTGNSPLIFLRNPFGSFEVNNSDLGFQGDFTVTGALAQGDSFI